MEEYLKINKKAYNKLSIEYLSRTIDRSEFEEKPESLANSILKFFISNSPKKALEIGPGSGEILECFEKNGCRTIAVDISPKIIEIAKKKSPNTIFINSNILEVNFHKNQFEIIYAGALIHLFPLVDARKLIKNIYCWLNYDGILFINTTINEDSTEGYFIKEDYMGKIKRFRRKWTENDFETLIIESNLEIIEKIYTEEFDRGKKWVALICKKKNVNENNS